MDDATRQETHASLAPPNDTLLVDGADSFASLLAALDAAENAEVPLDTEADSFHHYFEKVCLIQLAVGGRAYVVDPLASLDLSPLLARLAGRTLLLHGADYDLRLLHRGYGFRASTIFDTMIAAQLLGETEIGLAALLQKRASITLDKAHQRADWSERPLAPDKIAYAAADVLYLPALVASLRADLAAKDRLAWHEEEGARLVVSPFVSRDDDPGNDWRLKGTNALTGLERAFVRGLWEAREQRAREIDRPPFRVLTNERILDAARRAATGEIDLSVLFPGPRSFPTPFTRAVKDALDAARALPEEARPAPRRGERVEADPALERTVEKLKKKRDASAKVLGLDPGVVASRGALTAAARALRQEPGLDAAGLAGASGISRWRARILLP